jgi:hypothetical protein
MSVYKLVRAVDIIAATKADQPKLFIPDDGDEEAFLAVGPDTAERIVRHLADRGFLIVKRTASSRK